MKMKSYIFCSFFLSNRYPHKRIFFFSFSFLRKKRRMAALALQRSDYDWVSDGGENKLSRGTQTYNIVHGKDEEKKCDNLHSCLLLLLICIIFLCTFLLILFLQNFMYQYTNGIQEHNIPMQQRILQP